MKRLNKKPSEIVPGDKIGRLTAICYEYTREISRGRKKTYWRFRCDCGNEIVVCTYNVFYGNTSSCGCYKIEVTKATVTKHGGCHTRLHKTWMGMKYRCYNKKSQYYYLYGGRGITVCDEWLHDFVAFRDWALANGYADDLLIDRIDNDKGYSPDNCRWATAYEQVHNRRPRKVKALEGMRVDLRELAEKAGIPYGTFKMRVHMWGDLERAMSQPLEVHNVKQYTSE